MIGRRSDEWLDSWIFSGEDSAVRDVMACGTWVVRDGRHARQEEVAERFRDVARRLRR
jgi:formimidoylglutamate deiminase